MARLTQAEKLARYRARIEASRRWRENRGYVDTWKRLIDLYRGRADTTAPDDTAMVNMAFAVHNVVVASVTTQYPKFTVSPNQMDQDSQAIIAEAVLNYAWRHYECQDEFQLAVNDCSMVGHGWLKVGWKYEERSERRTLTPEEQMVQVAEAEAMAQQMAGAQPQVAGELPNPDMIEEAVQPVQTVTEVVSDDPFCERVSVFDVVIDPEATSMRELRWIAHRSVRDLNAVHDDPAYDAAARRKVQADSIADDEDSYARRDEDRMSDEETDDDRVTIWQMYDLVDDTWCTFAEAGDGFLIKPADIPTTRFKNPFVMFRDYEVPDTFFPIGEIESIESLQEELNKTRTQQINSRKQYVRKFIAREAALNDKARMALMSELDGDVALITDDDRPLNDVIIPAPALSFDPNLFNVHSGQIVQDMQLTTGLSDYQFGQMPDTRRLATEAMAVEGATNARSSFKLSRIERTLALAGRYLLGVMQEFMDGPRVARITGPGGEMLFVYEAADIEGEFDFIVEAGSTQPKNDMIRRQEAMQLFQTLSPFMGTLINPNELIRYLLQQGFDVKNVDRFMLPPAPPPMPGQVPPGEPGAEAAPPGGGAPPPGGAAPMPEGNGQAPMPMPL